MRFMRKLQIHLTGGMSGRTEAAARNAGRTAGPAIAAAAAIPMTAVIGGGASSGRTRCRSAFRIAGGKGREGSSGINEDQGDFGRAPQPIDFRSRRR